MRSREGSQVAQHLAQFELVCEHAEILAAFTTISQWLKLKRVIK